MNKKKKNIFLMELGCFICLLVVIQLSYAYWTLNLNQSTTNIIMTSCLNVNFTEENVISLEKAYPMNIEEAKKLIPYTFTITNNCEENASYQINLEVLEESTFLKSEYIRAELNDSSEILTNYKETEEILENARESYELETGVLTGKEEKTFSLRLWMDESTPPIDEVMNKTFLSKVAITASYKASEED